MARAGRTFCPRFVADADQDSAEIAWQAAKIGYDNIIGERRLWVRTGPRSTRLVTATIGSRPLHTRQISSTGS